MARYHKREYYRDDAFNTIAGIVVLYFLYLFIEWNMNRAEFWSWLIYGLCAFILLVAGTFLWRFLKEKLHQQKINHILGIIQHAGLDNDVKNFINRFGMQRGKKDDWTYRGKSFDWDQLKAFRKVLNEKGMNFSSNKLDEISSLLKAYIDKDQDELIRESISLNPRKFLDISGSEFENLLYRLFVAMGYVVQKTGKVGDQGADLITNKDGQRIVIQAKRYTGSVGNDAVQQAISAQKFYDCNRAMVVTNSNFTKEAFELAKVSNIRLIGSGELSELLLQNLKESWS
jgi:hypothetical protein